MAAWSKRLGTIVIGGYLVAGCFTDTSCDLGPISIFPSHDAPDIVINDARGTCGHDYYTSSCSPTAQTGCNASEKCTWVLDPVGGCNHVGCAPNGTIPIGGACGEPDDWGQPYDPCVKTAACVEGECRQICDNNGGTPSCDGDHTCTIHDEIFTNSGSTVAGVCESGCNPLTQELTIGTDTAACGSVTPELPYRGCYGFDSFACAPVFVGVGVTRTDRTLPETNASGNPWINGCSPGFMPFLFEATGSTRTLCTGLCAALETDNTPAHIGNAKGDPNALGKLPNKASPEAGDATCDIGKKGSHATSVCRFIWPYVMKDDGTLDASFDNGPYRDTLGVCIATAFYQYDANGDTISDTIVPDCSTLPPHSDATPGEFDDAADFGCQTKAHTPLALAPSARIALPSTSALVRHDLR